MWSRQRNEGEKPHGGGRPKKEREKNCQKSKNHKGREKNLSKTVWGRQARSQGSRLVQRSCSPGLKHDDDDDDGDDDGDCGNDDDDDDFLPQTVV